mgnify:CR=1 FL=1
MDIWFSCLLLAVKTEMADVCYFQTFVVLFRVSTYDVLLSQDRFSSKVGGMIIYRAFFHTKRKSYYSLVVIKSPF